LNAVVTQENLKALGVLVASFLASIVVASFFYIQPGSAQASAENAETCSSEAQVKDLASKSNTVQITITTSPSCPTNQLNISVLSGDGYKTFLFDSSPTVNSDGTKTYQTDVEISPYAEAYYVEIENAFRASIVP